MAENKYYVSIRNSGSRLISESELPDFNRWVEKLIASLVTIGATREEAKEALQVEIVKAE